MIELAIPEAEEMIIQKTVLELYRTLSFANLYV